MRKLLANIALAVTAVLSGCVTLPPPVQAVAEFNSSLPGASLSFAANDYAKELSSRLFAITNLHADVELLYGRTADVNESLGFGVYHAHFYMNLGVLAEQYFIVEFHRVNGQWVPQDIKFLMQDSDESKPEGVTPKSKQT